MVRRSPLPFRKESIDSPLDLPSKRLETLVQRGQHEGQACQVVRVTRFQITVDLPGQAGEEGLHRGGGGQLFEHRSGHGQGVAQVFKLFQRHEQQAVVAEEGEAAGIEYFAKHALLLAERGIERVGGAG